jgi:hypothetical protein
MNKIFIAKLKNLPNAYDFLINKNSIVSLLLCIGLFSFILLAFFSSSFSLKWHRPKLGPRGWGGYFYNTYIQA